MKSHSPAAAHLFNPPGLSLVPPGHQRHDDEETKVGRGHRKEESECAPPSSDDRLELSSVSPSHQKQKEKDLKVPSGHRHGHHKEGEGSSDSPAAHAAGDRVELTPAAAAGSVPPLSLLEPSASITIGPLTIPVVPGGSVLTSGSARPPQKGVGSAEEIGLTIGSVRTGGSADLLVTEPMTGKLHFALNFRAPNDSVVFSATGDFDLLSFAFSFKVDVLSIQGTGHQSAGPRKAFSINLSLKMSELEFGVGSFGRDAGDAHGVSPTEMAFHLIQLITRLTARQGDQAVSVDFSSPEARAILDLDGGRFGQLLLGFLYMLANRHSESDPDGPDHYTIHIRGGKHLSRFYLAFQELTIRQVSLSVTFTIKPGALVPPHGLPPSDRKDTLRDEVAYGPDGHARNYPHPIHARGRALRATA